MAEALPENLLEDVAERFRVLGDSTRLRILRRLLDAGELNVGEVADALATSQANASKHLRILHDANILARRQAGTSAYYAIADQSVRRLCDIVCDRIRDEASLRARAVGVG